MQDLGVRVIEMQDELASLVSTNRDDYVWSDSIADVKALIAERDSLKEKLATLHKGFAESIEARTK